MSEPKNEQQVTVALTEDSSSDTYFDCQSMNDDVASDDVRNSLGEITNTGVDVSIQLSHKGSSNSGTRDNSASPESRHPIPAFMVRLLAIFSCCSSVNKSAPVSRVVGEVQAAIEEYIAGRRQCLKNIKGEEISVDDENDIRQLLADWNTFLQRMQGVLGTSAIISSDIKEDINNFIEFKGEQWNKVDKEWIISCLQLWNRFLQARAGETLVTGCGMSFTVIGLFFYLLDLGSDIGTAIHYAYNRQWWQAILTLVIVYGSIIINTVYNWLTGEIHCTGSVDWLRYISSLLVNWPDVKQYGVLCLLEWKLYKSPEKYARLVPEWHRRRLNVAFLKGTEGVCEACPQAILQLYLLAPDLYGDLTLTDYLRIGSVCISLCTAGAVLTNDVKYYKIVDYIDLPTCELVVLHVWAVPVTVSRLLSVALLLTVEPYWCLTGVALHCVLRGVYWCRTIRVPRALADVLVMCLASLWFFISPFDVVVSITYRRVLHAIHFLGNAVATLVLALDTPLACSDPALYTAIIYFNAVMFVLGLVGLELHEKYWPR